MQGVSRTLRRILDDLVRHHHSRPVPVWTVDVMEHSGRRFVFQLRGELTQGGVGPGDWVEVEGIDQNGRFTVHHLWNLDSGVEVRWARQPHPPRPRQG
jgi:hypothetical protein